MEQAPCISQIASLLADPKRTAMLWALMDGSSKSSAELAALAELSPASANAHLARLTSSGLLRVEARRGTRVFRMAAAGQHHAGQRGTQRPQCNGGGPGGAASVAPRPAVPGPPWRRAGGGLVSAHDGGGLGRAL